MADVGIVLPVYKQDSVIFRKAIKSILKQQYRNFRLVIVIDGVTSNVRRIANHYANKDSRIRVIPKKENRGTAAALNIGFNYLLKKKRIKYLTWVSSDNIYYPNFVGVLRKKLKKSPRNVGLAYGSFRFINARGKRIKEDYSKLLKLQKQPKENLINYYFIGYSFMYKKKYAQKIEGYKYTPVEDYDYFLRLTETCHIAYVPKILMDFRVESPHSNSLQITNSKQKRRRRRYLMHLVMNEARQRRNINPEITVIFHTSEASAESIQSLEMLLDQTFSNYKLLIYDVSDNQNFFPVVNQVPDIRIQYFSIPNGTIDEVLKETASADTGLVMFYRTAEGFSSHRQLAEMINSSYTNTHALQVIGFSEEPLFGKIYKTNDIKLN